jgi:hypothetical protein
MDSNMQIGISGGLEISPVCNQIHFRRRPGIECRWHGACSTNGHHPAHIKLSTKCSLRPTSECKVLQDLSTRVVIHARLQCARSVHDAFAQATYTGAEEGVNSESREWTAEFGPYISERFQRSGRSTASTMPHHRRTSGRQDAPCHVTLSPASRC